MECEPSFTTSHFQGLYFPVKCRWNADLACKLNLSFFCQAVCFCFWSLDIYELYTQIQSGRGPFQLNSLRGDAFFTSKLKINLNSKVDLSKRLVSNP